jgi:ParB family transcriptional regulator, chromosome partitioning protein
MTLIDNHASVPAAGPVTIHDRRFYFVGPAYLADGGGFAPNPLGPDHPDLLADPALLDRLATAKLTELAEPIRAQGWQWVQVRPVLDITGSSWFRMIDPAPLFDEHRIERETLWAKFRALFASRGDMSDRLHNLREPLQDLPESVWHATDMARSGVIVTLDLFGVPSFYFGLIQEDDGD